jgi:hypothetical protein
MLMEGLARAAPALALGVLALSGSAGAAPPPPPYPVSTAPPEIQGSEPRQDGQTLTATTGSWTAAPQSSMTFAYQWFRCTGTACSAIPGATGKSYTLGAGEVARRVKVRVTGNCTAPNPVCQPMSRDSGLTGTVLADPNNERLPEVGGNAVQGQVLSGSVGFWRSVASLSFGYQWLRCDLGGGSCVTVAGATGATYRLTAADAGHRLRVGVTARNSRPREATVFSAATAAVQRVAARRPAGRGLRLLSPFPRIVLAGVVTRSGAAISEFTIRGPRGASIRIRCRGRGCPFRTKRLRLRRGRVRVHALERRLRAGITIEVTIGRRGFIGKFSRFRIRRGSVPARTDLCLRPAARRPTRCPRGA